jgi:ArsR family transcriptional regulator
MKESDILIKDDLYCDCDVIHADVVEKVKMKMPDEDELYDLSDFFKVLGDSTRAKIIWALDESDMCVCDLAVLLNMTKSAISHQLRSLRQANLVKFKKEGKVVIYSLTDDHVRAIFEKGLEHIREK